MPTTSRLSQSLIIPILGLIAAVAAPFTMLQYDNGATKMVLSE